MPRVRPAEHTVTFVNPINKTVLPYHYRLNLVAKQYAETLGRHGRAAAQSPSLHACK
jgi:hypothetical protein